MKLKVSVEPVVYICMYMFTRLFYRFGQFCVCSTRKRYGSYWLGWLGEKDEMMEDYPLILD